MGSAALTASEFDAALAELSDVEAAHLSKLAINSV